MDEDRLDKASDVAFARLQELGGDPSQLPHALRVVVTIYSAQGVIDNGGLRYFFESDWPGQPAYSTFADAYRAIGADPEASGIEEAAALFAFPHPERDADRRRRMLEGDIGKQVEDLERQLTSDVWERLRSYVRANEAAFEDGQ